MHRTSNAVREATVATEHERAAQPQPYQVARQLSAPPPNRAADPKSPMLIGESYGRAAIGALVAMALSDPGPGGCAS